MNNIDNLFYNGYIVESVDSDIVASIDAIVPEDVAMLMRAFCMNRESMNRVNSKPDLATLWHRIKPVYCATEDEILDEQVRRATATGE